MRPVVTRVVRCPERRVASDGWGASMDTVAVLRVAQSVVPLLIQGAVLLFGLGASPSSSRGPQHRCLDRRLALAIAIGAGLVLGGLTEVLAAALMGFDTREQFSLSWQPTGGVIRPSS